MCKESVMLNFSGGGDTNESLGPQINLLWTGGWDSTFRLIQLSRMSVIVQPIYLLDASRRSVLYERRAMNDIMHLLHNRDDTVAKIQPVLEIDINTIPKNSDISDAYKTVCEHTHLGIQHEWLARYAFSNDIVLELGTEYNQPTVSSIINALQQYTVMKETNDVSRYAIDENLSSREGILLFSHMRFPIIDFSEVQMREIVSNLNYDDVMRHIWFCHSPIKGKPCGLCHPCSVKMESNMEFLLDGTAQIRYYRNQRFNKNISNYSEPLALSISLCKT